MTVNAAHTDRSAEDYPTVSIIVPVLNEERHIEQCLASIQAQTYPRRRMEIIVVDGGSTDRSRAILQRWQDEDGRIQVLDNPARVAAAGLNIALAQARGEFVLRVDAHCVIAPDYVQCCVACLTTRSDIGNVGGILHPIGETTTGEAIAAALQSPFSMGWSPSRYSRHAGERDTVYLGAFRRCEIYAVGAYRATLKANEDYELNIRLRAAGRKIWCDPAVQSQTFTRERLGALARQYAHYGYWKARVLHLHPASTLPRHLAAPAFVAALLLALAAGGAGMWEPFWALCGSYVAANLFFAWQTRRAAGRRARLRIPLAFAVMHLCWGAGFWAGWLSAPFRFTRDLAVD